MSVSCSVSFYSLWVKRYILTRVWVNTTSALSSSHKYCQASIEVWGHVKKCQHCMQTSASFSQRFILVAKARFLSTTCDSSPLLSSRKVLVLENSQEPIYKSLSLSLSSDHNSLSLDHKSLSLDHNSLSLDHKSLSLDHKSLSLDHNSLSLDHKSLYSLTASHL